MSSSRSTYLVSATARLNAPPHRVYETIANYHTEHPRILPRQFSGLTVERGGIGAGTVICFQVKVLGKAVAYRSEVTEPEPGHTLVETNVLGSDSVTTFMVEPGAHQGESVVTIKTEIATKPGIGGAIERFLISRVLPPIYDEELRLLEGVAAGPLGTAASANSRA
jgi:hypothetical protein